MNFLHLSHDERRAVCEDLLAIMQAGRLSELAAVRQQLLRGQEFVSHSQLLDAHLLARQASRLIGGTAGYWREAADAAVGIPSETDLSVEAVCRVADDARQWQEPQRAAPPASVSVGRRKRGAR